MEVTKTYGTSIPRKTAATVIMTRVGLENRGVGSQVRSLFGETTAKVALEL